MGLIKFVVVALKNSCFACVFEKKAVPLWAECLYKWKNNTNYYNNMIYKITFSCDDVDDFRRVFEADSEATFLELHEAILKSAG